MVALRETLISSSVRAEISENQTHNLIFSGAKLKCNLNYMPCSVCTFKVRSLLGKELYHEIWKNDMWEDSDEAGDTEPLNSYRVFFASKNSLSISEISSVFPEESVKASPKANFPLYPLPPPFVPIPITRLKPQKVPEDEEKLIPLEEGPQCTTKNVYCQPLSHSSLENESPLPSRLH